MSKARLIQRLKWYYPTEKFHAFLTFPVLLLYVLYTYPFKDIVLLTYALVVCIIILYQGQKYWKLKLQSLTGQPFNQEYSIAFFLKSKRFNRMLLAFLPVALFVQLYLQGWAVATNSMFLWGVLAGLLGILEYINYYHVQLMIDNKYDFAYVIQHRKLKKASLAKDLIENKI